MEQPGLQGAVSPSQVAMQAQPEIIRISPSNLLGSAHSSATRLLACPQPRHAGNSTCHYAPNAALLQAERRSGWETSMKHCLLG